MNKSLIHKTPALIPKILPGFLWHLNKHKKQIALTFDDGPTPEVTCKVLDILNEFEVKSTFFCIGKNVENYPELFDRILNEGHAVGNHTHNHLNGWKVNTKAYIKDVEKAKTKIESNLFRPPYGKITPAKARALKQHFEHIVLWTGLSVDYSPKISPEKCLKNAIGSTQNGTIMVFHDSLKASKNMLYALPRYLEFCKKNNFEFVKL
jgi:peptidoglycan/xylan/chitin deacetylase (PgdA/CDA1 family)